MSRGWLLAAVLAACLGALAITVSHLGEQSVGEPPAAEEHPGEQSRPAPGGNPPLADSLRYLVQLRCADGGPPLDCEPVAPLRAGDPLRWRRHDWPPPLGYQTTDAVLSEDGSYVITAFSFAPWGRFDARRGDGGDIYVVEGGHARAAATQDGGTPWLQFFVGPRCGGTGWVLFPEDIPTGSWGEVLAQLSDRPDPASCPPLGPAYTRYRRERVPLPFIVFGERRDVPLDVVISEHYNARSIAQSRVMERFYFARDWGRVLWAAWATGPPKIDLSARCPAVPWNDPPRPDWQLHDCRLATNLVREDRVISIRDYGWPPPGFKP